MNPDSHSQISTNVISMIVLLTMFMLLKMFCDLLLSLALLLSNAQRKVSGMVCNCNVMVFAAEIRTNVAGMHSLKV